MTQPDSGPRRAHLDVTDALPATAWEFSVNQVEARARQRKARRTGHLFEKNDQLQLVFLRGLKYSYMRLLE